MKKGVKIALGVAGGVILVSAIAITALVAWGVSKLGESFSDDPKKVESTAREITDYQLPPGYKSLVSINLGFKLAGFSNDSKRTIKELPAQPEQKATDDQSVTATSEPDKESTAKEARQFKGSLIMLMSFPKALFKDKAEMKKQVDESLQRQGINNSDNQVVETKTIIVRGKETTLTRMIGKDKNSKAEIEQVFIYFEGKSDPAIFMAMAPKGTFDEEGINSFINSMK
jgi:hypothetical protein